MLCIKVLQVPIYFFKNFFNLSQLPPTIFLFLPSVNFASTKKKEGKNNLLQRSWLKVVGAKRNLYGIFSLPFLLLFIYININKEGEQGHLKKSKKEAIEKWQPCFAYMGTMDKKKAASNLPSFLPPVSTNRQKKSMLACDNKKQGKFKDEKKTFYTFNQLRCRRLCGEGEMIYSFYTFNQLRCRRLCGESKLPYMRSSEGELGLSKKGNKKKPSFIRSVPLYKNKTRLGVNMKATSLQSYMEHVTLRLFYFLRGAKEAYLLSSLLYTQPSFFLVLAKLAASLLHIEGLLMIKQKKEGVEAKKKKVNGMSKLCLNWFYFSNQYLTKNLIKKSANQTSSILLTLINLYYRFFFFLAKLNLGPELHGTCNSGPRWVSLLCIEGRNSAPRWFSCYCRPSVYVIFCLEPRCKSARQTKPCFAYFFAFLASLLLWPNRPSEGLLLTPLVEKGCLFCPTTFVFLSMVPIYLPDVSGNTKREGNKFESALLTEGKKRQKKYGNHKQKNKGRPLEGLNFAATKKAKLILPDTSGKYMGTIYKKKTALLVTEGKKKKKEGETLRGQGSRASPCYLDREAKKVCFYTYSGCLILKQKKQTVEILPRLNKQLWLLKKKKYNNKSLLWIFQKYWLKTIFKVFFLFIKVDRKRANLEMKLQQQNNRIFLKNLLSTNNYIRTFKVSPWSYFFFCSKGVPTPSFDLPHFTYLPSFDLPSFFAFLFFCPTLIYSVEGEQQKQSFFFVLRFALKVNNNVVLFASPELFTVLLLPSFVLPKAKEGNTIIEGRSEVQGKRKTLVLERYFPNQQTMQVFNIYFLWFLTKLNTNSGKNYIFYNIYKKIFIVTLRFCSYYIKIKKLFLRKEHVILNIYYNRFAYLKKTTQLQNFYTYTFGVEGLCCKSACFFYLYTHRAVAKIGDKTVAKKNGKQTSAIPYITSTTNIKQKQFFIYTYFLYNGTSVTQR